MSADLAAAREFMSAHARPLDRLRFALASGDAVEPHAVLGALGGYAAGDGGYGHGLDPDLRAPEAQPVCAMHAFEVIGEVAPATSPQAVALCGWLARATLPDGGLPLAAPIADPSACAPFWATADPRRSSLRITAAVAAAAHRVARTDPAVAMHPWLVMATGFCLERMERTAGPMPAYELMFSLRLLDAVDPPFPRASRQLERLGSQIPRSGRVPVAGGAADEFLRPLDFAPHPADRVRRFIPPGRVDEDLARLAAGQAADGGWTADRVGHSPEAEREWRGHLTVRAVRVLSANGALG